MKNKNKNQKWVVAIVAVMGAVMSASAAAGSGARIEFWAPHMSEPINITAPGQSVGSGQTQVPKVHRYEIWGFQSGITLGDQAEGAIICPQDPSPKPFRLGYTPGNAGGRVNSWVSVGFTVNGLWYPDQMYFEGGYAGESSGDVVVDNANTGKEWDMTAKFPSGFALVPHLSALSQSYMNLNPRGYFYVLGVYQEKAPELTGKLYLPDAVLSGEEITVGWEINRGDVLQYATPAYAEGNVASRSGLADGTNPGKGSGTSNSPNEGTNNPGYKP